MTSSLKEALSVSRVQPDKNPHAAAIVTLLDQYARDPMGLARPIPEEILDRVPDGLAATANALVWLAYAGNRPAGVAVCFSAYATFRARPVINVHDLAVLPEFREQGVATHLLNAVESEARRRSCAKLTLEVRQDNTPARTLYRKLGFSSGDPPYDFWSKVLD